MPINDSRQKSSSAGAATDNGNNGTNSSGTGATSGTAKKTSRLAGSNLAHQEGNHSSSSSPSKSKRDPDAKSTHSSTMSTLNQYPLIDDDHIDDQETINVGNLIIDLESDLEKEKIEHEQASSTRSPSSSTSFTAKPSFLNTNQSGGTSGPGSNSKPYHKSSGRGQSSNSAGAITGLDGLAHNSHSSSPKTIFRTSSDERSELKLKITREAKSGKNEHKIVTSPNHQKMCTMPSTSSSCFKSINEFNASSPGESSSISSTKECGTSTSIGTITEPDCLGPCEPGTSVTLEGIVWQETDGGILVVNVTWRGKTYVGALLDCTKHDWAPPRLCDSPVSDIDLKTHKSVRAKRIVTRSNGIGVDEKNLLQTTGKLRNGKGRRILTSNELGHCNKKQRDGDKSSDNASPQIEANALSTDVATTARSDDTSVPMNVDATPAPISEPTSNDAPVEKAGPNSPMLIGCSEPNCSKKYRNMNGLLYHQTHAHGGDAESASVQDVKESQSPNEKLKATDKEDIHGQGGPSLIEGEVLNDRDVREIDQEGKIPFTLENQTSPSPQRPRSRLHDRNVPSQLHKRSASPQTVTEQQRPQPPRNAEHDRRSSSGSNNNISIMNIGHRSPGPSRSQQEHERMSKTYPSSKPIPSNSRQQQLGPPPNLPATTEEGMKPSGTSTGPPPAPHQANYYFNSGMMANSMSSYGIPPPFLAKNPLPPYHDALSAQTPQATNAALIQHFMENMRGSSRMPPTSEPSRLMGPSMPKNLPPYPPFRLDHGMPMPNPQMGNPPLSNLSLGHPTIPGGSPNLRMPIPTDHLLPPSAQLPIPPPAGMLPSMGLNGPGNPLGLAGPQMPSLVEDTLAKQFPRRYN